MSSIRDNNILRVFVNRACLVVLVINFVIHESIQVRSFLNFGLLGLGVLDEEALDEVVGVSVRYLRSSLLVLLGLGLDAVEQLLELDGFGDKFLIIALSGHHRYRTFEGSRLGKDTGHASEVESTLRERRILNLLVVGDLIAGFLEMVIGRLGLHEHVEEVLSSSLLMVRRK